MHTSTTSLVAPADLTLGQQLSSTWSAARTLGLLIAFVFSLFAAPDASAYCNNVTAAVIGLDGNGQAYIITPAQGPVTSTMWYTWSDGSVTHCAKSDSCTSYSESNHVTPTGGGGPEETDCSNVTLSAWGASGTATVGVQYWAQLTGSGGSGPYQFSVSGLPNGLYVSGNYITGTPTESGTFSVTVIVTDGSTSCQGTSYGTITVNGSYNVCDTRSVTAYGGGGSATVGQPYNAQITGSGGRAPYTISVSGLYNGLYWNDAKGYVQGTPNVAGTVTGYVTVTDADGCTGSTSFTISITNPVNVCDSRTVTSFGGGGTGTVGVAYWALITGSGGRAPYNFSVSGLPTGLTQSGGWITGTPTVSGRFTATVSVTDADNCRGSTIISFDISPAVNVCDSRTISIAAVTGTGTVGTPYSATLSASGGRAPYNFTVTGLPSGLTQSGSLISGTPTTAGRFTATVAISDADGCRGSATIPFDISPAVNVCDSRTITITGVTSTGTVGTAYSATLIGSGGRAPYIFTVSGLPSGLAQRGSVISGIPTKSGSYTITVTATDADGCTSTLNFPIVISARCGSIAMTPTSINATVGTPSNIAIYPSGSSGSYISISVTGLPSGMSAQVINSGLTSAYVAITGTPAISGTFPLSFTITDSLGCQGVGSITLTVARRPGACATTWAQWQADNPLSGQNGIVQNPDGDLFNNLLEYALCNKPNDGLNANNICLVKNANGTLDLLYTRAANLTDITFSLQGILDLAQSPSGWQTLTATPTITVNGDLETVRYTGINTNAFFGARDCGFIRLQVRLTSTSDVATSQAFGFCTANFGRRCVTFSHPFLNCEVFSGLVSSAAASSLSVTTTGNIASSFQAGTEYFVEVISGTAEGQRFEINEVTSTANVIALDLANARSTSSTLPASIVNSSIVVRAHHTLGKLFPTNVFAGTTSASTADHLVVFNRASQNFSNIWLLSSGSTKRWLQTGDSTLADRGPRIIDNGEGLFVHPMVKAATNLYFGAVRGNKFGSPLVQGSNLIGMAYPLNLSPVQRAQTVANGFVGTNSASTADKIQLWQQDDLASTGTGYDSFFLLSSGSVQQWTKQGDTTFANQNNVQLFKKLAAGFVKATTARPAYTQPLAWQP